MCVCMYKCACVHVSDTGSNGEREASAPQPPSGPEQMVLRPDHQGQRLCLEATCSREGQCPGGPGWSLGNALGLNASLLSWAYALPLTLVTGVLFRCLTWASWKVNSASEIHTQKANQGLINFWHLHELQAPQEQEEGQSCLPRSPVISSTE